MKKPFIVLCEDLKLEIQKSYEEGITLEEAEKLAGKFLSAQISVAEVLKAADLDARMKKSGSKAVKAALYMQEATKGDKKPSDTFIQNIVDMNEIVQNEQNRLDAAEVEVDALNNYYNIFREAHIFFRGVSRGRFE